MRRLVAILVALLLCPLAALGRPALPSAAQMDHDQMGQMDDGHDADAADHALGTVHFATSCSAAVQADFDRGVAMLHSFWFVPAREAFAGVAQADPQCGMAYWGIAMTWLGNPFGGGVPPTWVAAGTAAVEQARAVGAATPRERAYIEAIAAYYEDAETRDYRTRALAYAGAMEQVYRTYPEDTEAAVFYALALDVTAPPEDKTYANVLRADAILEQVFAEQPDHPGVTHYLIHSNDYPPLAQHGLAAARRYAAIAPAVPHAQHMPSHIFTRLGYWEESIASNLGSLDAAWAAAGDSDPTLAPPDVLHPMDYLMYAYLQTGQDEQARAVRDEALAFRGATQETAGNAYAFAAIPARYALERGQWAEAAALTAHPVDFPWNRFPEAEAITTFARALGAARNGDAVQARVDAERLATLRDALTATHQDYWAEQVDIQREVARAWVAWADGQPDAALETLRAAADHEAQTEKAPVTPGPLAPARELLGEMLLLANAPAEALAAFEATLQVEPNRFRALYGAARAAEAAGDAEVADQYYAQLLATAEQADTERPELAQARTYLAGR